MFQQLLHFGRFGLFASLVGFPRSNEKSKDVGFPDCLALLEFAPKQKISRQIRCDPIIDYELMVISRWDQPVTLMGLDAEFWYNTIHNTQYTIHNTQYTKHNTQNTIHKTQTQNTKHKTQTLNTNTNTNTKHKRQTHWYF